ncbi:Mrp/NBP35 family ATP-binding protein [Aurantimicrobium minutum]|uniref:Mrp/NBP35 family ATP-binding protein n=1 Tax=Aurantimicrobium minutum TaxID=708131 RepID=UPI00248E1F37|nr:P-loop NTPase [Aurantimicrobium minutum]
MTELVDRVRSAVETVIDPELRLPLGELGMVGKISNNNGNVSIQIKLTIVGCPASERIRNDVLASAMLTQGVSEAEITLDVMTDDERAEMLKRLRPGGPKVNPFGPGTLTRVIAITSGKGGVGKSTITANLAIVLSALGYKVGILDADVYGFSIPKLMGIEHEGKTESPTRLNDMIVPLVNHDVKIISIGMFVENSNAAVAWRGPMLQRTITQFLTDVYFGDLDFLLLDLPPGTGDVAITVGQQLPNAEVLVVTTGQSAASDVAIRSGVVARQTGQSILGVVENMGPLTLPDGSTLDLFGEGGADTVAAALSIGQDKSVEVLGRIPLSIEIRQGGDIGYAVSASLPDHPASQAFKDLAHKIIGAGPSRAGINLGISPA